MQCSDLEWFYCKNGEVMDANKAMEKRFAIYRRIGRKLKDAHNRSNDCAIYSGLDESIYYRCDGAEPSVSVAQNNPWVKRTEDIGITTALGTKRLIETAASLGVFPIIIPGMNFSLKSRLSQKSRIMQENIEALYLVRFYVNPYDNFTEVINIIIGSIFQDMPPSRRNQLISSIYRVEQKIGDATEIENKINSSFRDFGTGIAINMRNESIIRKYIVTAILTGMISSIALQYPELFAAVSADTVIARSVVVITVLYSYGTIEKMSQAAIRLKQKNSAVYSAMAKSKLTMAYYFVEVELGPLITLAASPSNAASDSAFIAEVRHLIKKYDASR